MSNDWKKIKSEAQANNILRREIKKCLSLQEQTGETGYINLRFLLRIKPGSWYKFYKLISGKKLLLVKESE